MMTCRAHDQFLSFHKISKKIDNNSNLEKHGFMDNGRKINPPNVIP